MLMLGFLGWFFFGLDRLGFMFGLLLFWEFGFYFYDIDDSLFGMNCYEENGELYFILVFWCC